MKLPPVSWALGLFLFRARRSTRAQRCLVALLPLGLVLATLPSAAAAPPPPRPPGPGLTSARPHLPNESIDCSAKGPLSLQVEASWDGAVERGELPASLTVALDADAASVRIRTSGEGVLANGERVLSLGGPWTAGATRTVQAALPIRGAGNGRAQIIAEALDVKGNVLHLRRVDLYALAEGRRLWGSYSSYTDLLLWRAQTLAATGELDAVGARAAMEAVVTAAVPADARPLSRERMTVAEERLQQAIAVIPSALPASAVAPPKTSASPAAPVTITVSGKVLWTDKGGKTHGVPMATVEIRDEDVVGSELITTVMTNAAGNYTATFTHDDGPLQGNPDIFVRVLARSPIGDIKPDAAGAETYAMTSPTTNEVADGSSLTINLTAGNAADNETVFGVHHALVMIGSYAGGLAGTAPSQVDVRFPTTRSTSLFDSGVKQLHILKLDRFDWDVIHHEYGHYFQNIHGFQANPGGRHSFNTHLAQTRGSKDVGVRLAWGEGWPTFFGTSGQNVSGAAGLMVPNVGDTRYTDTEDSTNNIDLETNAGVGEDDEVSTMSSLWDLFDAAGDGADQSTFGDKFLFNAFKSAAVKTIGAAWEAIAATLSTQQKTVVGGLFGQAMIAPELTAPADNFNAGATPPAFTWTRNGGGPPNPLNDFRIRFYKNDFSSIIFEKELGNVTTFTPSMAEWATIVGGDSVVKWVVEGKNTSAPVTPGGTLDHYWSRARSIGGISIIFVIDDTGSMGEEIAGVRSALQSFIDAVAARGGTPPTIQLITFKDNVTTRITSNNLDAVRSAVAALFASGGGDCPEAGAQALQVAAGNISPGGTILFATDASSQPGVDNGAVVAQLRAKRVTMNTVLSGDCVGIMAGATLNPPQAEDAAPATPQIQFVSGAGATRFGIYPSKPGDDDPGQDPIVDPGQPPPDEGGDTPATATTLLVNQEEVRGLVGLAPDAADYFQVHLEAGRPYAVTAFLEGGTTPLVTLYDTDGTTFITSGSPFSSRPAQLTFRPTVSGDYFVAVTRSTSSTPSAYRLKVAEDAFAFLTSAVQLFSTMSAETGGAFIVRDDVNTGARTEYEAALFNIMSSTLGPSVLQADSDNLPQGTMLAIELVGRGTNWRTGSTVSFAGTGIDVVSVTVSTATRLTVLVNVDASATLGFRDVTVQTPLGSATETAAGRDLVEIVPEITAPTLLSVEPNAVSQNTAQKVTVRGINTAWKDTSMLSLGDGITITSRTVLSPTLIEAMVEVDPSARIGFRAADVTTDGATEDKQRALFVNSSVAVVPQLIGALPNAGERGQVLDVDVTGSNTSFVNGTTTASFGDGITVLSVTVTDATHAKVRISIASGAAIGFRSILLTTGGEVATLIDGFFVAEATIVQGAPLLNLSSRLCVLTADKVGIGGFIITGGEPKKVIIRGLGQTLSGRGLSTVLADPLLKLYAGGTLVAMNDNWKDSQQLEIENSMLAPTHDSESAIVATLDPGAYTAVLSGAHNTTGIGLVEVFDLGTASSARLSNISTRCFVGSGDEVLIAGLIVGPGGSGVSKVILRARGPSLASSGLTGLLADPTMQVYNAAGDVIASNDDWKDVAQADIEGTGLAPTDDRESALIFNFMPGPSTAIVRGKNGGTGVGIVEVFALTSASTPPTAIVRP